MSMKLSFGLSQTARFKFPVFFAFLTSKGRKNPRINWTLPVKISGGLVQNLTSKALVESSLFF